MDSKKDLSGIGIPSVGGDYETSSTASLDVNHPMHWPIFKRWTIVFIYSALETFVLLLSSTYPGAEFLVIEEYALSSTQVFTLGQSMMIVGNAVGVTFLGPLSDVRGRKWVYVASTAVYAILNLGTAYALNFPMLVIFMFLAGIANSTALNNVAATVSDLFGDSDGAAQPMALFVVGGTVGPTIGTLTATWIIDANLGLKWIFLINVIIGVGFAVIIAFVPETLPSLVIANTKGQGGGAHDTITEVRKAETVDTPVDEGSQMHANLLQELKFITTTTFRILFTQPIIALLGIYNGVANGILLLYITGLVETYLVNKHLSLYAAELNAITFIVGVVILFLFVPVQTYLYGQDRIKHHGHNRPEARLLTSLVFVWLYPIAILWSAFTSGGNYSYWSQVVAGGVVGFTDNLLYLAQLNFITDCYPNVAGSAIAAFLIPSFIIQAALAHLSPLVYANISIMWALAMLGFLCLGLIVPVVYVIYFLGPRIRARSSLAKKF
ncbi:hypothetical protein MMC18_009044 [Xylographa bjoerkii]|nr:hypothetical protein [Xylographa bjoerkii]